MVNGCRIYLVIRYPLQISISADKLSSDPRIYTHFLSVHPHIHISVYPSFPIRQNFQDTRISVYPCIRHIRSAKNFRTPEYPCIRVSAISVRFKKPQSPEYPCILHIRGHTLSSRCPQIRVCASFHHHRVACAWQYGMPCMAASTRAQQCVIGS